MTSRIIRLLGVWLVAGAACGDESGDVFTGIPDDAVTDPSPDLINAPPIASAGWDQRPIEGVTVTLSGAASHDPDGDVLTFAWTQKKGPLAELTATTSEMPSFVALKVENNDIYIELEFELIVTDTKGHTASDRVGVTVLDTNLPPQGTLTGPATANPLQAIILTVVSSDPDGTVEEHNWLQISGTTATVDVCVSGDPLQGCFTMPNITVDEDLVFGAELVDDEGRITVVPHTIFVDAP